MTRSGMISIIGRPNVGKSTLLNALVGEKVSIVTQKPQTTRHRICGVVNRDGVQMVFMDTPGFHKPRTALGRFMVGVVQDSVSEVDCILLVVEPEAQIGTQESLLIQRVAKTDIPCVLVINKIDTIPKEKLLEVIAVYGKEYDFAAVVPLSAARDDGIELLLGEVESFMPEGPNLFPDDMISDQAERVIIGEIIREKTLSLLEREVPHGVAVAIDSFSKREDGLIEINATLFCEKSSHKGIIIGKYGAMLGRIGTLARQELETMFGEKVLLKLWVKVKENWRDNQSSLRGFGYE